MTIDGDLQDDPAEIPRLLAKLDEGYDLVSGWKTKRRDPITRRIPSKIFNTVAGKVSGVRLHDMNCGLKAYRAEVVDGMQLYGELHRYIPVLAHYRGYRVTELPVNHRPREHGRSNYGVERYVRGFLDLLTVTFMGRYRHRPLHLFGGLGLLFSLIGSVILVYLTIVKIIGHAIGQRPLLLARGAPRRRRHPAALARAHLRADHEPPRGAHRRRGPGGPARGRSAAVAAGPRCAFSTSAPTTAPTRGTPRSSRRCAAPASRCASSIAPSGSAATTGRSALRQMLRVAEAEHSLRKSRDDERDADALIVGYPGHFDLPAAKRVARGRPVIFNPLVSLFDTIVDDRQRFRRGSPGAGVVRIVDRRAFRRADRVVADTDAHAEFFRDEFGLAADRVEVCFVGAEDRLFRPGWQPDAPFHALFVGKLIPLHGLETILAAAALAPEIPFRVVGSGQLEHLLDDRPRERRLGAVGRLRRPARTRSRRPVVPSASSARPRRPRG